MDWTIWRVAWVAWCSFWAVFWLVAGFADHAAAWGLALFGLSVMAMRLAIVPTHRRSRDK